MTNRLEVTRPGQNRKGSTGSVLLIVAVAATLLAIGGYLYVTQTGSSRASINPITADVIEGDFLANVLDQGEIQSSENVEIRCRARARNGDLKVIEVVPEGTRVKAGDFLVRLDKTGFETEMEQQKIAVANAETAEIQAKATLDTALASKDEYINGLFLEQKKTIENEVYDAIASEKSALQEQGQAVAVFDHSVKLQQKGFITQQQLDADRFAIERAEINLKKARNAKLLAEKKLEVLEEITFRKEEIRLNAEIESAKIKYTNDQEALKVEKQKLVEIQQQIDNCLITVPEGIEGQVVYAQESSRGGNEWILQEGTTVRENQVLLRLPNPSKMEVKALIAEQSITQIKTGMPATIRVDALNNQTLKGVVTKVNQYAEQNSWFSSSSGPRKYAVLVKILNPVEELKPGMNASVTIQTRFQQGVLLLPIQCVYGVENRFFCLKKSGPERWETVEIETGGDNAQYVLVKSGLNKGDTIAMNPAAYKGIMDLPEIVGEVPVELSEEEGREAEIASQESAATGPSGGGGGGPPTGGGFDLAGMMNQQFTSSDANGDGKIDSSEQSSMDDRMKSMMERMDSDKNGEITKAELDSAVKRMAERMKQGGGGGPGAPGGGRPGGN